MRHLRLLGVDRDGEHGVEADDLAEQGSERDERGVVGPHVTRSPASTIAAVPDDLGRKIADDPEHDSPPARSGSIRCL